MPPPAGNRREYEAKLGAELAKLDQDGGSEDDEVEGGTATVRSLDPIKLSIVSRLCSVAQTAGYAGREDVARTVHGAPGNLLKKPHKEESYGSEAQLKRARGYASKLLRICEDVAVAKPQLKTLVIIHRNAGCVHASAIAVSCLPTLFRAAPPLLILTTHCVRRVASSGRQVQAAATNARPPSW